MNKIGSFRYGYICSVCCKNFIGVVGVDFRKNTNNKLYGFNSVLWFGDLPVNVKCVCGGYLIQRGVVFDNKVLCA